jgi:hypothetical protein
MESTGKGTSRPAREQAQAESVAVTKVTEEGLLKGRSDTGWKPMLL